MSPDQNIFIIKNTVEEIFNEQPSGEMPLQILGGLPVNKYPTGCLSLIEV